MNHPVLLQILFSFSASRSHTFPKRRPYVPIFGSGAPPAIALYTYSASSCWPHYPGRLLVDLENRDCHLCRNCRSAIVAGAGNVRRYSMDISWIMFNEGVS